MKKCGRDPARKSRESVFRILRSPGFRFPHFPVFLSPVPCLMPPDTYHPTARMHTLLIHQAFCVPGEAGGTRHFELGGHACANGQRFTVVASRVNYLTGKPIPAGADAECACSGIQLVRAYAPNTHRQGLAWRIWSFAVFTVSSLWAAYRVGAVDLVMGTTPPIFQTLSSWLLSRLRRVPFLLEVRDLWPEFAVDMGLVKNRLIIALARWFERWLYRRADHVLVNSPAYRDYIIKKGVLPEHVTVIPNGVDPSMFDPDSTGADVRAKWGASGKFVVTYAGAIGLANDIPTILRAARRLKDRPDIVFWLVGDGGECQKLQQLAGEWGLSNVRLTGPQPKARMREVLAASDACVATLRNVPMFATTYPNKVFDYMAAGRPVLLAIDGVIRAVIEAAGCGLFVPPGDDERLAASVLQLRDDPERARKMGQAGRKYVLDHFDREEQGREFVGLLRRVAGKGGVRAEAEKSGIGNSEDVRKRTRE